MRRIGISGGMESVDWRLARWWRRGGGADDEVSREGLRGRGCFAAEAGDEETPGEQPFFGDGLVDGGERRGGVSGRGAIVEADDG